MVLPENHKYRKKETMKRYDNIVEIAEARLCNSCGACQFVCSTHAIEYNETVGGYLLPVVNKARCIGCGMCKSVCPGKGLRPNIIELLPHDPFVGNAISAYVGKAQDAEIYNNSQSGGIVTALLCNALQTNFMQGSIVVVMKQDKEPRPLTILARSRKEIIRAQKSKYCPVPVLSILDEVKANAGTFAFVGTPCQIHGLRNIIDRFPHISNKIAIVIGLFCEKIMSFAAIDHIFREGGIGNGNNDIEKNIIFKEKSIIGYPGEIKITAGKSSIVIPKEFRMKIKDYYTPDRCRLCFDKLNILADISIGDPWGNRRNR
jgi:coenzyme F420 hydrogenase subunit beta